MPECIALPSPLSLTSTLVIPRSVVVSVGTPTAKLPVSTTRIVSALSRSAFGGTNSSRPPVPCSSEPSQMIFTPHGKPPPLACLQRAQRREVHDDVALAVRRAAPVPAAVALGELPDRRRPQVLAERRLHVVVAVQEHRRRPLGPGRVAVHAVAAVRRRGHLHVLQADLGEGVDDPLRRLLALLGRVLLRVGDRLERDELGQVGLGAVHQAWTAVRSSSTGIVAPCLTRRRTGSVGIVWTLIAAAAASTARTPRELCGGAGSRRAGRLTQTDRHRQRRGPEAGRERLGGRVARLLVVHGDALLIIATAATATAAPT